MTRGQHAPSFWEWLRWAENAAYGILKIMPEDFYSLTPMELEKVLVAREKAQTAERWERAYWVSLMLNIQLKKKIKVEQLMRPFLPKKDTALDRDQFFADFAAERRKADGDRSGSSRKNRG